MHLGLSEVLGKRIPERSAPFYIQIDFLNKAYPKSKRIANEWVSFQLRGLLLYLGFDSAICLNLTITYNFYIDSSASSILVIYL